MQLGVYPGRERCNQVRQWKLECICPGVQKRGRGGQYVLGQTGWGPEVLRTRQAWLTEFQYDEEKAKGVATILVKSMWGTVAGCHDSTAMCFSPGIGQTSSACSTVIQRCAGRVGRGANISRILQKKQSVRQLLTWIGPLL